MTAPYPACPRAAQQPRGAQPELPAAPTFAGFIPLLSWQNVPGSRGWGLGPGQPASREQNTLDSGEPGSRADLFSCVSLPSSGTAAAAAFHCPHAPLEPFTPLSTPAVSPRGCLCTCGDPAAPERGAVSCGQGRPPQGLRGLGRASCTRALGDHSPSSPHSSWAPSPRGAAPPTEESLHTVGIGDHSQDLQGGRGSGGPGCRPERRRGRPRGVSGRHGCVSAGELLEAHLGLGF